MRQFIVTGMSCAACQARVEKAVAGLPGVESCAVSLLTNTMGVRGQASDDQVIQAVEKAGYGASVREEDQVLGDSEVPVLRKRLIWSLVFLAVLMYISMGHTMLGLPLPSMLSGHEGSGHIWAGTLQMVLAAAIMYINRKFFISGTRALRQGGPNMDTLVALGSGTAFAWSLFVLVKSALAQSEATASGTAGQMDHLYFETAAMILTLITVGKLLEAISKGRTTDALKALMEMAPEKATVLIPTDGREDADPQRLLEEDPGLLMEKTVPVEEVRQGDIFVVRPGESVPVDGVVLKGRSSVDESALTGESIPVDKGPGQDISAATINHEGFVTCKATRVGYDTTLSQIIKMVSDAAATKAPIAKIADRVSAVFVPAVILVAAATWLIWLIISRDMGFSLARGIAVLVVSCPCALGLATPVAIMVGSGLGARKGILFKTSESLEMVGRADMVCLDKTGTITRGIPVVTDIVPAEGTSEEQLLQLAFVLERKSEHPVAKAVVDRGEEQLGPDLVGELPQVEEFEVLPGNGVRGSIDGQEALAGKEAFVRETVRIPGRDSDKAAEKAGEGKTCLFFARGGEYKGAIFVADSIKEDSPLAVRALKDMGIRTVMITGDREETAAHIARETGIDTVYSQVLPQDKEKAVRELSEEGRVIMVGDGINDAPALTQAHVGVALGAGTDVAIDAADVVLMEESLTKVASAIKLGKATVRNIHQNLFWAFFYNVLLIPLAAGAYTQLTGWTMDPMLGAAAMSLSSFCVVTNALRLNMANIDIDPDEGQSHEQHGENDAHADMRIVGDPDSVGADVRPGDISDIAKTEENEEAKMQKTINIEGMMCKHCEANVKGALEALAGVDSAEVSHETGKAVVTMSEEMTEETLKEAVEAKDYKVLSFE